MRYDGSYKSDFHCIRDYDVSLEFGVELVSTSHGSSKRIVFYDGSRGSQSFILQMRSLHVFGGYGVGGTHSMFVRRFGVFS